MAYTGVDRGSFEQFMGRAGAYNRQMLKWVINQKQKEERASRTPQGGEQL